MKKKLLTILLLAGLNINQTYAFWGIGDTVFDPTSYASLLEAIEKYNTMIQNMQETLDTMNKINDLMNTSTSFLNNMQLGIANPLQLADRFQSNINSINRTLNRIQNNISNKQWENSIFKNQIIGCQKKWQELRQKNPEAYENNEFAQEVDANLAWLTSVNNDGLATANSQINSFFDSAIYEADTFTNLEKQIDKNRPRNPRTTASHICRLIEKEYLNEIKRECLVDYHEAMDLRDTAKAQEAMDCIKEAEKNLRQVKIDEKSSILDTGGKSAALKTSYEEPTLSYNYDSCTLNNSSEWQNKVGTTDVLEKIQLITQDSEGNQTSQTICVVTQDAIDKLFEDGVYINDILKLQNQRNKSMMLQRDSYAIEKAQLETLEIIANLMTKLNEAISIIARIDLDNLQDAHENLNKEQEFLKRDDTAIVKRWTESTSAMDKGFEYNQYGLPVRKVK